MRLTKKDFNYKAPTLKKLGQLEDIEEELGVDLITLFKAQTQGFHIINVLNEIEKVKLSKSVHVFLVSDDIPTKTEVYSAVWTDKGLKYVAKMNEKGELELL